MRKILFTAFMACTANTQAATPGNTFWNGNIFYGKPELEKVVYVLGVVDAYTALKTETNFQLFCPPPDANGRQLTDVVKKHMNDHPETRHYAASSTILVAMRDAFPCK